MLNSVFVSILSTYVGLIIMLYRILAVRSLDRKTRLDFANQIPLQLETINVDLSSEMRANFKEVKSNINNKSDRTEKFELIP